MSTTTLQLILIFLLDLSELLCMHVVNFIAELRIDFSVRIPNHNQSTSASRLRALNTHRKGTGPALAGVSSSPMFVLLPYPR